MDVHPWARRSPAVPAPTLAEWRHARARLAELDRQSAGDPRTLKIALKLREPYSGRLMEARGAVAIAPPDALRMVLLGPGGTTALDLWASGKRYRFAVPALDLLRRGDASTPRSATRGLPVDFLRWWLLRPFAGTLLWYARESDADRFVLRDDHAIIDLRVGDAGPVTAQRTTFLSALPGEPPAVVDVETVATAGLGCGVVRYRQASTHLDIVVTCEGLAPRAPNPRAFVDPDAACAPRRLRERRLRDRHRCSVGARRRIDAYRGAPAGACARVVIARDAALEEARAALSFRRPRALRSGRATTSADRATDLLAFALRQAIAPLDRDRPGWRDERIGVAIGTSSGGMLSAERFFAARAEGPHRRRARSRRSPRTSLRSPAPSRRSGSPSFAAPTAWRRKCSRRALRRRSPWASAFAGSIAAPATWSSPAATMASASSSPPASRLCAPPPRRGRAPSASDATACRSEKVRGSSSSRAKATLRGARVLGRIAGFGASNDAVHITAPDRTGSGLARAAAAAIADSGWPASRLGLVSAHATATPFNDAMGSRAIASVFEGAPAPVVHAMKAQIGYTLGAAGSSSRSPRWMPWRPGSLRRRQAKAIPIPTPRRWCSARGERRAMEGAAQAIRGVRRRERGPRLQRGAERPAAARASARLPPRSRARRHRGSRAPLGDDRRGA